MVYTYNASYVWGRGKDKSYVWSEDSQGKKHETLSKK
jgi:hypothetical protein